MKKYKKIPVELRSLSYSYLDMDTNKLCDSSEINIQLFCMVDYGNKVCFYKNGNYYNDCGPAIIVYTCNEKIKIKYKQFCLNGNTYPPERWLQLIPKEKRIAYLFNLGDFS